MSLSPGGIWRSAGPAAHSPSIRPRCTWGRGGIAGAWVFAEIDAGSFATRQQLREADIRSANFLDVENHPTSTFLSTTSRRAFGVSYNAIFGTGKAVVADKVDTTMNLEFIRESARPAAPTTEGHQPCTAGKCLSRRLQVPPVRRQAKVAGVRPVHGRARRFRGTYEVAGASHAVNVSARRR